MAAKQFDSQRKLHFQKGMATIEASLLMMVFTIMICYVLGTFGVVHTSILHSIAARAHAYQSLANRADVTYFAEDDERSKFSYRLWGFRAHGIIAENQNRRSNQRGEWDVSGRRMAMGLPMGDEQNATNANFHLRDLRKDPTAASSKNQLANPVWIKTVYGICINSQCGGS
jgi:hypothetical protein